ncbi:MAG: SPOR domain-containing protein [Bryobacteraceae bacterium]
MATIDTDEGREHDMILGNKQLLSVFFIVVVLLGVFFTMGYIIGRNTGALATVNADGGAATAKPVATQADKPSRAISPEARGASEPETAALPLPNASPQGVSQGLTQQAQPYDESRAAEHPAANLPAIEKGPAPTEGRKYLQVMAVKRQDAEKVEKILNGQGFPATLRESSKEGLIRVLVGPYPDRPALSKAKDDLKSAGFDAIVAH